MAAFFRKRNNVGCKNARHLLYQESKNKHLVRFINMFINIMRVM